MGTTDAATRGQEVFETCVPCHNADGSGNPAIGAPNIAGMKAWYVERELDKFRAGVRGMHFSDVEGMRMRPMALSLTSEDDVKAVAHYVETLHSGPARIDRSRAIRKPERRSTRRARPAMATMAPGIRTWARRGLPEWTTGTSPPSCRKFRSGVRGTDPKDREGRLMRPMARALPDEDAIRNVVAYTETLKP